MKTFVLGTAAFAFRATTQAHLNWRPRTGQRASTAATARPAITLIIAAR